MKVTVVSPTPAEVVEVVSPQPAQRPEVSPEVQVWAHDLVEQLSREQAAIDWSQDAGALVVGFFRAHGEKLAYITLALYMLRWVFLR